MTRWRYDVEAQTVREVPGPEDGGTEQPDDRDTEVEAWGELLAELERRLVRERQRHAAATAALLGASAALSWAKQRAIRRAGEGFG